MERRVKIPISDIMDDLVQRFMNQYGVERSDVKCLTKIEYIMFQIPALDDELCNEVLPADIGENGEVIDGCRSSAGAWICCQESKCGQRDQY